MVKDIKGRYDKSAGKQANKYTTNQAHKQTK
jgi:hypothetical protein